MGPIRCFIANFDRICSIFAFLDADRRWPVGGRYQLGDWRQWQHHLKTGKKLYNRFSRVSQCRSRSHDIKQYLAWSKPLSKRMSATVQQLQEAGASSKRVEKI